MVIKPEILVTKDGMLVTMTTLSVAISSSEMPFTKVLLTVHLLKPGATQTMKINQIVELKQ